jgi:DNA-directed RNA polymerase subunit F
MLGRKQENSRVASLAQVKEILKSRSAEPDFGFEQQSCLDYANKFCKLGSEDAAQLQASLEEISSITAEAAIKLVDILPQSPSTVQIILAKEKITLDEPGLAKTMELINAARERMIAPPPKAEEEGEKPAEQAQETPAEPEPKAAAEPKKAGRKKKAQKAEEK